MRSGGDPNAIVEDPDGNPLPLLRVALYDREEEIALRLLEAGADFESSGVDFPTVVQQGTSRVLGLLIREYPRAFEQSLRSSSEALIRPAATYGYPEVLEILIVEAERHEIPWSSELLSGALSSAVSVRQNGLARILLAAGAVPTGLVIRVAARDSSPGMVRTLLRRGADASAVRTTDDNYDGPRTPVAHAWNRLQRSAEDDEKAAALLIITELRTAGAEVPQELDEELLETQRSVDAAGRLLYAARFGMYEDAAALLQRRDELPREVVQEAAELALRTVNNDVAELLMMSGVSPDGGLLHAAARGNSPHLVRDILARGAAPDERVGGMTPVEHWWEARADRRRYLGPGVELVLHELIKGGADACWLENHESELDAFAQTIVRYTATECWED